MKRRLLQAIACSALGTLIIAPAEPTYSQSKESSPSLTFYHWWSSVSELAAVDALVEAFKSRAPEVAVSSRSTAAHGGGGRMLQLVTLAAQGGRPPDVFQVQTGAALRPYLEAGLLLPIDEIWAETGVDKVVPPIVREMSRVDGHYYSMPINVHRNNLVWYNKALLDKHGIDPAGLGTWDDVFRAADKLRAAGVPSPLQIGEAWTLALAFESLMAGQGIGAYEDWVNGKITSADDARLLGAFGVLKRYLSYANADHAKTAWDAALKRVIRGEAAFCTMGDWADGEFQLAQMRYGKDYGALPAPGTRGMYGVTVDAFAQTRGAANVANARAWMAVAASRQGQDAFNAVKGSISARTDADAGRYNAYQRAAMADFKAARYLYPNLAGASHGLFRSGVDNIMARFASDLDVTKAAAAMAAAAAQSRDKFRPQWSLR